MQGRQLPRDYLAAEKLLSQAIAAGVQEASPLLRQCEENLARGKASEQDATTASAKK